MTDAELKALIQELQLHTALARISQSEVEAALRWMLANGYTIAAKPNG